MEHSTEDLVEPWGSEIEFGKLTLDGKTQQIYVGYERPWRLAFELRDAGKTTMRHTVPFSTFVMLDIMHQRGMNTEFYNDEVRVELRPEQVSLIMPVNKYRDMLTINLDRLRGPVFGFFDSLRATFPQTWGMFAALAPAAE